MPPWVRGLEAHLCDRSQGVPEGAAADFMEVHLPRCESLE